MDIETFIEDWPDSFSKFRLFNPEKEKRMTKFKIEMIGSIIEDHGFKLLSGDLELL